MNLDPDDIKVNKLVRLGRREMNADGTVKCRPLRFTVDVFNHKRQILTVNSLLRSCDDDIFGNIYFTPDLTKTQRKKAYELRTERGLREERGERNLKISRGQMVTSQLVPKSTRTLVKSYLFLVNSYLSQLVPKSTRT